MAALLRLLVLLPPLLLPSSPVFGNEGAAAGSCKCHPEREKPWIVQNLPKNLKFCDICPNGKLRFHFPRIVVCGHKTDLWALSFWNSSCNRTPARLPEDSRQVMRAKASRPHQAPPPSSVTAAPTETSLDSGLGTSKEVPRTQPALGRTTGFPQMPGRVTNIPVTDGGPSRPPLQEETSPHLGAGGSQRVAVISLLGVALTSVAITVLVLCRRRRRGRGRHLAHYCPSGHPGEEERYLPCEET